MAVGTRGRGKKAAGGDADTPAFGGIAERYRRAGDLDKAVALCREGLKKFPDQISGRVTLGWALLDQGKYDEAQVELEYALKRAPDNLAAIRGLAELHDRAENTMMLPMDGPGQWPPDPAMIEEAAEAVAEQSEAVAPPPPPEPEPPAASTSAATAVAADTRTSRHETPAHGDDTRANGYDTTPAVYTRASDPSPAPARQPATMDIDPPISDAELAALTALLQQEEAQAAAEAQLTPAAPVVVETPTVVEETPPMAVTGADLALELLNASTHLVEPAPELAFNAAGPDDLIAALEAQPQPEMDGVTEAVEVSKTFEVPGTLQTVEAVEIPVQTFEVPGTLEVAIGEIQETFEVPGTLEVREAAEVPQTFEAPEPSDAPQAFEPSEPAEMPPIADLPPMVEMPLAIEAQPAVEMPERVETSEPFDLPDLEMPTGVTDAAASEEFPQSWAAEAAPPPAREPEMPDGIAAFEDHFQAAEHAAHVAEVVAFPSKHEDPPAKSDEAFDRDDDLIHAPAAADASAFAARELPAPLDSQNDDLDLTDVAVAAAAGGATEDFAARIAESAVHARAVVSAQENSDFRGPADLRADDPPDLQGWAVALEPSAMVAPEPADLRSEDPDDDYVRQGDREPEEHHRTNGYHRSEETHHPVVVAAPAAAAVAMADRSSFAKATDDRSPANRFRKMLRRIEMRRLETARESVA